MPAQAGEERAREKSQLSSLSWLRVKLLHHELPHLSRAHYDPPLCLSILSGYKCIQMCLPGGSEASQPTMQRTPVRVSDTERRQYGVVPRVIPV